MTDSDKEEEKRYWYFSFGVGHYPHHKHYVKIFGTFSGARNAMFERFSDRWCMQYQDLEDLHPVRWGLTEYKIENGENDG